MLLSNISNDILKFVFNFLSNKDILSLIKTDKRLIYNFKNDGIKIQLELCFSLINDDDLSYLTGIHKINLNWCKKITDHGLQYLKGVHTIFLFDCDQITDQGLQYLIGVHTINLYGCIKITDQGLQYLKGVHTINLFNCEKLTDKVYGI